MSLLEITNHSFNDLQKRRKSNDGENYDNDDETPVDAGICNAIGPGNVSIHISDTPSSVQTRTKG
jgi:hypothetical protein